jgi:hypothetical protein
VLVAGGVTAAVALPRGTQPGPAFASTSSALLDPQTAASADPSSPAAASSAPTSTSSRSAAAATKAPGTAPRTTRTTATTVPATPRGQATRTTAAAPATHPTPTTTSPVTVRRSHGQVPVLVVGDSVSMTLAYGIRADAATAGFRVIDAGQMGCGVEATTPYRYFGDTHDPVPGCVGWDQRWAADLRRYDPAVTIVMVGRRSWTACSTGTGLGSARPRTTSGWSRSSTTPSRC